MNSLWDWKVTKSSFSRLEVDIKQLVASEHEIYQIVAVQEVKPARAPFEIVVISRRALESGVIRPDSTPTFQMQYSPMDDSAPQAE